MTSQLPVEETLEVQLFAVTLMEEESCVELRRSLERQIVFAQRTIMKLLAFHQFMLKFRTFSRGSLALRVRDLMLVHGHLVTTFPK